MGARIFFPSFLALGGEKGTELFQTLAKQLS